MQYVINISPITCHPRLQFRHVSHYTELNCAQQRVLIAPKDEITSQLDRLGFNAVAIDSLSFHFLKLSGLAGFKSIVFDVKL